MADRPILFSGPMVRALLDGRKTQTRRVIKPQPPATHAKICACPICEAGRPVWRWYHKKPREDDPASEPHAVSLQSVGDRLWVREAWAPLNALTHSDPGVQALADRGFYRADDSTVEGEISRWRPSIHMPRWASRLTLIVTDVRVQRLQEISEADALAEGVIRQDPTPEDEEWNRQWSEDHGFGEPDPLSPVWLAPGTRQGFGPRRNDPKWGPTPEFAYRLLWDSINGERIGCLWSDNPWVVALTFTVHRCNIDQMPRAA